MAAMSVISLCRVVPARSLGGAVRSLSAAPSLAAIKELRELSGAPIVDCKKALTEGDGDMDAAWEWLRKRGAAVGQKVASREAKEGLVGVASSGITGAIVELNSETDFAARNEGFQQLLGSLLRLPMSHQPPLNSIGDGMQLPRLQRRRAAR